MAAAETEARQTGKPARRFKELQWTTLKSWSVRRRVIAKAEWLGDKTNSRKLLKIGAQVSISLRRIKIAMASAFPLKQDFATAHANLAAAARS